MPPHISSKARRPKERKIILMLDKVLKWRKYSKGIYEKGEFVKLNLS